MSANCFGRSKQGRILRLSLACVCWLLLYAAVAGAGSAPGQSSQSSATSQPASGQAPPPAGQSGKSATDQSGDSDVDAPSLGDQPGSYIPEEAQGPAQFGQAEQKPAPLKPATTQSLMPLGAPKSQPATLQPAAAPVAAAPEAEPVDIPAAHSGDQRRQQINDECANLLKMANSLKAQVDKTTKDELSISVVRQANQIEQLAHKVKDEIRPAVASKN